MEIITPKPIDVHILVGMWTKDNLQFSQLVFDTIKKGFPSWPIHIWDNFSNDETLKDTCAKLGATYHHIAETGFCISAHWEWIRHLVAEEKPGKLCLVDTDVIFFDEVQSDLNVEVNMIGEYIPSFFDPVTKKYHVERLHPAVMMLDTENLAHMEELENKHRPPSVSRVDLIRPQTYFARGAGFYYDTLANAFHRLNKRENLTPEGQQFPTKFVHLHCGTWLEHVKNINQDFYTKLRARQLEVIEDPEKHYIDFRKELVQFYIQQGAKL